MKKSGLFKILSVLVIILIISTIIYSLYTVKSEKTETTLIALDSIQKANAASYSKVRVTSSSKKILEKIVGKVPDYVWLPDSEKLSMNPIQANAELNRRKSIHNNLTGYYIEIPKVYFMLNYCEKVTEFDFSGINLRDDTILPDFTLWPKLKKINFSNCCIIDDNIFYLNRKKLKNLTYIDLRHNCISKISGSIIKDSRYDFRYQEFRS